MRGALWLWALMALAAGRPNAGAPDAGAAPVEIRADTLDVLNARHLATWRGHVRVHRGTLDITCQLLHAHYNEANELTRIECDGDVDAQDRDKRAKGDHADYDYGTQVLVMTKTPLVEAWDGKTHVWGKKATFFTEENRLHVDGATTWLEDKHGGGDGRPDGGAR